MVRVCLRVSYVQRRRYECLAQSCSAPLLLSSVGRGGEEKAGGGGEGGDMCTSVIGAMVRGFCEQ